MESVQRTQDSFEDEAREKAIVEAFIRGEMSGFKHIYAKYRQRVFSYCLYYMGDHVLAEDAFQEVFTRVYTRREQLREPKALKSWLLLITRSVCLNMLRTSKFTPEFMSISSRPDFDGGEYKEFRTDSRSSTSAEDMLQAALQKIAPIYRDAFLMREFEGYEYEEIAELTGTTVMNVKVRITRAKKKLRIMLAPYYLKSGQKKHDKKTQKAAEEDIDMSPLNEETARPLREGDVSPLREEGVSPFRDEEEMFAT